MEELRTLGVGFFSWQNQARGVRIADLFGSPGNGPSERVADEVLNPVKIAGCPMGRAARTVSVRCKLSALVESPLKPGNEQSPGPSGVQAVYACPTLLRRQDDGHAVEPRDWDLAQPLKK